MLPHRLIIHSRTPGRRVVPRWLAARDEPWLRELAAEAGAMSGRCAGDVDDRIVESVARFARPHGASRRLVEAVWTVERRRWKTRIAAPVAPSLIRRTVFPLARDKDRKEAIATAATTLGIDPSSLEQWLFADRASERLLVAPADATTTTELVERYNLALVQALLCRATEIHATARAHLRRVVGFAKLLGLMLTFEPTADGAARMTLSGPLALFHETIKYGHALASWVPCLVTTPGWAISANLVLGGERMRFELDAGAPLPRTHAMSRPHDSRLEAQLERDLRALASPWRIEREAAVVRVDGPDGSPRLLFPDFALARDNQRVLVEVVGYWTPEYLAKKFALLDAAREALVICVDERHLDRIDVAWRDDPRVVTFKKRINAAALLGACARASMMETPSLQRVPQAPSGTAFQTEERSPALGRSLERRR